MSGIKHTQRHWVKQRVGLGKSPGNRVIWGWQARQWAVTVSRYSVRYVYNVFKRLGHGGRAGVRGLTESHRGALLTSDESVKVATSNSRNAVSSPMASSSRYPTPPLCSRFHPPGRNNHKNVNSNADGDYVSTAAAAESVAIPVIPPRWAPGGGCADPWMCVWIARGGGSGAARVCVCLRARVCVCACSHVKWIPKAEPLPMYLMI